MNEKLKGKVIKHLEDIKPNYPPTDKILYYSVDITLTTEFHGVLYLSSTKKNKPKKLPALCGNIADLTLNYPFGWVNIHIYLALESPDNIYQVYKLDIGLGDHNEIESYNEKVEVFK